MCGIMQGIQEAISGKEQKQNPAKIAHCPMFIESLTVHPEVKEKLKSFVNYKIQNPLQSFNKSDSPFSGNGIFGSNIKGLRHAHLSQDVSIVYLITGNPIKICLYGVFSHAELGTGQPANIKKQKSIVKRFSSQTF